MSSPLDAKTFLAALGTIVLWASAFPGTRAALEHFAPHHLALGRYLVASLVFVAYIAVVRPVRPPRSAWLGIAGLGTLGIAVYQVLFAIGLQSITAGTASVVIVTVPVFSALLAWLVRGESLSAAAWIGIGLCFMGAAIIIVSRRGGLALNVGALLVLMAALSTSLYFVLQRRFTTEIGPLAFTAYSIIAGTIPLLIVMPGFVDAVRQAPAASIGIVVYMGVLPSAAAYMLWFYALERAPAGPVTSFIFLQPVFVMLMAWVWLGEIPPLEAYLGGALTLMGLGLVTFRGSAKGRLSRA